LQRACLLDLAALDEQTDEVRRGNLLQPARQRLRLRDVHHSLDQEATAFPDVHHFLEKLADLVYLREARQERREAMMLPPRLLQVDDVVVQEVLARGRRPRQQLRAGRVADHRPERTDLRGHPYALFPSHTASRLRVPRFDAFAAATPGQARS